MFIYNKTQFLRRFDPLYQGIYEQLRLSRPPEERQYYAETREADSQTAKELTELCQPYYYGLADV